MRFSNSLTYDDPSRDDDGAVQQGEVYRLYSTVRVRRASTGDSGCGEDHLSINKPFLSLIYGNCLNIMTLHLLRIPSV